MLRMGMGLVMILSAAGAMAADASPKIELHAVADMQLSLPDVEIAPVVMDAAAVFSHTLVTDADISTIEIFEI